MVAGSNAALTSSHSCSVRTAAWYWWMVLLPDSAAQYYCIVLSTWYWLTVLAHSTTAWCKLAGKPPGGYDHNYVLFGLGPDAKEKVKHGMASET